MKKVNPEPRYRFTTTAWPKVLRQVDPTADQACEVSGRVCMASSHEEVVQSLVVKGSPRIEFGDRVETIH